MIYRQKSKRVTKNNINKMASKKQPNMKDQIRGFIFCFFWYFSILSGFFILICPILPLILFKPKLYRKWSDVVFGMWEPFPVAMMEILFGVRVYLTGDKINPFEGSLVIMNHRTRLDWNFLWAGLFHSCHPNSHNLKFVLKAPIMHIPGPGWVMQTCSFLFIYRNWEKDQKLLAKVLDYLKESDQVCQILIFPEGTDLSEKNIERSHKFADDHNLERYYRVLHPKTTGFAFLANRMRSNGQLKAIYDLTIGYPKTLPQTELDMLRGKFPEEIHFHIKRYDVSSVPYREPELKIWLKEIWQEKEKRLQKFYSNGSFIHFDYTPDCLEQNSTNELLKKRSELGDLNRSNIQNGISQKPFRHRDSESESDSRMLNQNRINSEIHSSKIFNSLNSNNVQLNDKNPNDENNAINENMKINQNASDSSVRSQKSFFQNNLNYEPNLSSTKYRPSHLLYLSLLFWTSLVIFTIYGLFTNFYIQVWILIHFVIFVTLSFVTKGFHLLLATFYLYRFKEGNAPILKKSE